MFGLGLGLGIHRHSNANPYVFPFISRVETDGGIIRDKAALLNLTYYLQSMMPNTKLLFCPELGVKLRSSGINNYVTKLYDLGPGMLDGAQTTALYQPYLSGNIAPNEKYAIKNPNGGNSYITHTPISFVATDKWSVSFVFKINSGVTWNSLFGAKNQSDCNVVNRYLRILSSGLNGVSFNDYIVKTDGKISIMCIVYDGLGTIRLYDKGIMVSSKTFNYPITFSNLAGGYYPDVYSSKGSIQYHSIRDIALSPTQIQDEYNYLRPLFPEIENVKIGDQYWATSNCEMTCTPQGNIIQEMQPFINVEKITNGINLIDSNNDGLADGFSTLNNPITSIVTGNGFPGRAQRVEYRSGGGTLQALLFRDVLFTNKWYRLSFKYRANKGYSITDTNAGISSGAVPVNIGDAIEKTIYFKHSGAFTHLAFNSWLENLGDWFEIGDITLQEVGWSDSTNIYNYIYTNTTGTTEQKEYAAVKAAAMWCYYNNDPAIGAVYGKLYNWYAVKLLQMDIDYYNAANPTAPWGWRVPSSADYITLSSTLGNTDISGAFLKKEGTTYWNLPNTNANNQSRFTAIGIGRRAINGTFEELNNIFNTHNLDKSKTVLSNASESVSFQGGTDPVLGMGLRLIKDEPVANDTLHGFEYTPEQNDDIVTFIGNSVHNTNKTIQSMMTPFEELISTKERFTLQTDVTKRVDGTPSNLTDPNYLQKVSIPEFWYGARFDSVRNKVQVWFSLVPVPGFMHIAQQAVCRYPGYIDGAGKARSHSGFKYPNNKNLIEFTTACQLTSTDLFVLPYYTYNALSLLLLHDIGRRNAQAVWAGLQTGSTYSNITSGKTDVLTTPSGEVTADSETASNKPLRWRFIENLYVDCWKILSGVYLNQVSGERRVMVCSDPYKANTGSVISADYIQACIIAAGEGWLKDINAPWINAKSYGASSTTGYCDYTYNNTTDKTILIAGGSSNSGTSAGPFALSSTSSVSYRHISVGARFASIDRLPAATQVVVPALIY